MQGLLTDHLSFTEVLRLFVANQSPHFQLDMLIALLKKGETTEEIAMVTAALARFIHQSRPSKEDLNQLTPSLCASLHANNTTFAHQLIGKFLLSGQDSLPSSEALSNPLQAMLEVMPTHPDLAQALPLLLIIGDEAVRNTILQKLPAVSLPAEMSTTWRALLGALLSPSKNVTGPSIQAPRLPLHTLGHFFSTGRINNSFRALSNTLSKDTSEEVVKALIEQLSDTSARVSYRCDAAVRLGDMMSTPAAFLDHIRAQAVYALVGQLYPEENGEEKNALVQCSVIAALGHILSAPVSLPKSILEESIDALVAQLDDDVDVRCKAAKVLGDILLPKAKRVEVVDVLLGLLLSHGKKADYTRVVVAAALGSILSAAVSLPKAKLIQGIEALLALVIDRDDIYDTVDHESAIHALVTILSASVPLPEAKREEIIYALIAQVNGHTYHFKTDLIVTALIEILNAIVEATTKNPTPNKANLPSLSEDAKANIVTKLFLKTEGIIKASDFEKCVYWDKGIRATILAVAPASCEETKKLHAIIGLVEACESAPAQVLQITDLPEVDEELPRASFKP